MHLTNFQFNQLGPNTSLDVYPNERHHKGIQSGGLALPENIRLGGCKVTKSLLHCSINQVGKSFIGQTHKYNWVVLQLNEDNQEVVFRY
jgi:hypothetical protein